MKVLFLGDKAQLLWLGNVDRRQAFYRGTGIPVEFELQICRELPEGRHELYSAPS